MKTRIRKIIIMAVALVFVSVGVSFAHDWKDRDNKPEKKSYGNHQVERLPSGMTNKDFRPNPPVIKRYVVYRKVPDHRYYDTHHRRPAPRHTMVHKSAKKDPVVVFKVILKDLLK